MTSGGAMLKPGTTELMDRQQIDLVILFAISMTTGAELVYFGIWGLFLYPEGDVVAKAVWTMACAIGMGSTIAAAVLLFVSRSLNEYRQIVASALIFTLVAAACAVLCSRVDALLNYFGGRDAPVQLLLVGIVPALIGGLLYGLLMFHPTGRGWLLGLN